MTQAIMYFALGFLCAAFLALLVAPALWRRAGATMKRRIEATLPMSLNEIQAEKDRMRADFAMSARRLEIAAKTHKDKATEQFVEISRNREELKRRSDEISEKSQAVAELEARCAELRAELSLREERLAKLGELQAETARQLDQRSAELDRISGLYEEASFSASSRQIELVARENEVEKLNQELALLRTQRKDNEKRVRDAAAESRVAAETLGEERKRIADLEKKLERLTASLSDRDEKIDRREKELERLREKSESDSAVLKAQLAEALEEQERLHMERLGLTGRRPAEAPEPGMENLVKRIDRLEADRSRLERRVAAFVRENKRLRAALDAQENAQATMPGDAALRAKISDLAAEMVNLTAIVEGPDSEIDRLIRPTAGEEQAGVHPSLADRIRALREAAG